MPRHAAASGAAPEKLPQTNYFPGKDDFENEFQFQLQGYALRRKPVNWDAHNLV
jgi:hypothetical protein